MLIPPRSIRAAQVLVATEPGSTSGQYLCYGRALDLGPMARRPASLTSTGPKHAVELLIDWLRVGWGRLLVSHCRSSGHPEATNLDCL